MKKLSEMYPHLHKLGIKIYNDPIPHVRQEDVNKVLTPKQKIKFDNLFGAQTCTLLSDGMVGLYPYDVEAVFMRML